MTGELTKLVATAKMGFAVVPISIHHSKKGYGLMYLNKDGIEFKPSSGGEPITVSWEEFDKEMTDKTEEHL